MKLILSSPLEEKTTKRKCSFLWFTQEMKKKNPKLLNCYHAKDKFIPCICSLLTIADLAIQNKALWTLSLSKSSVPDTLSSVAFPSSTGFFHTLGTNHMLLAIYHPHLKFFSYRHTVKFSGQVKSVGEQHK